MNLDEMIKSYSDELMSYAKEHNSESLVIKNTPKENTQSYEAVQSEEEEGNEELPQEKEEEKTQEREESQLREIPAEEDMESFATFKGRVLTGFGAFPVENAKVILYRNNADSSC